MSGVGPLYGGSGTSECKESQSWAPRGGLAGRTWIWGPLSEQLPFNGESRSWARKGGIRR